MWDSPFGVEQRLDTWLELFNKRFDKQSLALAEHLNVVCGMLDDDRPVSDSLDQLRQAARQARRDLETLFTNGKLLLDNAHPKTIDEAILRLGAIYVHLMNNRLGLTTIEEAYVAHLVRRVLEVPAKQISAASA
ncbi:MAG: lantibiotic dehydratase C-terminal domain-containing protein [Gemmatimonadaceae bacterium]